MTGWYILKILWVCMTIFLLCVMLLIFIRARGVFSWRKALKTELDQIKKSSETISGPAFEAHEVIEKKCNSILSSNTPEIGDLKYLYEYIQSIASCFYPKSDHPELQVSVGALLGGINVSLERFDRILKRPVFKRLNTVNIRQVNQAREWYAWIGNKKLFQLISNHQKKIQRIAYIRFLIFLEPMTWAAFLSSKLTTLLLVKYLLVDLYLFFGILTLTAFEYHEAAPSSDWLEQKDTEELEKILEELNSMDNGVDSDMDPRIRKIRSGLVGMTSVLKTNPGFFDWKEAVMHSADIIARKYFPDSEKPLEEASLGPLLERSLIWIDTFRKGEDYFLARRFYKVHLSTIYQAKNISDFLLPVPIRNFIEKTAKVYGLLKWPLSVYRWIKKRSPWIVALNVGWLVAKKAGFAHFYGKAFDKACMELEVIYCESKKQKRNKNRVSNVR